MRVSECWYSIVEHDPNGEDRLHFKQPKWAMDRDLNDDYSRRMLVQECASDYHNNHDGWEASWPKTFALYESEDGPEIAKFSIEREMEPAFYAHEVKR